MCVIHKTETKYNQKKKKMYENGVTVQGTQKCYKVIYTTNGDKIMTVSHFSESKDISYSRHICSLCCFQFMSLFLLSLYGKF